MARNANLVAEGETEAIAGIEEGVLGAGRENVGRANMLEGWLGEVTKEGEGDQIVGGC